MNTNLPFATRIRDLPTVRAIEARNDFTTLVAVPLQRWMDRDRATWWCETMWRDQGQQYRRRIDAVAKLVTFEFAEHSSALEFHRLFGEGEH